MLFLWGQPSLPLRYSIHSKQSFLMSVSPLSEAQMIRKPMLISGTRCQCMFNARIASLNSVLGSRHHQFAKGICSTEGSEPLDDAAPRLKTHRCSHLSLLCDILTQKTWPQYALHTHCIYALMKWVWEVLMKDDRGGSKTDMMKQPMKGLVSYHYVPSLHKKNTTLHFISSSLHSRERERTPEPARLSWLIIHTPAEKYDRSLKVCMWWNRMNTGFEQVQRNRSNGCPTEQVNLQWAQSQNPNDHIASPSQGHTLKSTGLLCCIFRSAKFVATKLCLLNLHSVPNSSTQSERTFAMFLSCLLYWLIDFLILSSTSCWNGIQPVTLTSGILVRAENCWIIENYLLLFNVAFISCVSIGYFIFLHRWYTLVELEAEGWWMKAMSVEKSGEVQEV